MQTQLFIICFYSPHFIFIFFNELHGLRSKAPKSLFQIQNMATLEKSKQCEFIWAFR